jgi:hypothetical protein
VDSMTGAVYIRWGDTIWSDVPLFSHSKWEGGGDVVACIPFRGFGG